MIEQVDAYSKHATPGPGACTNTVYVRHVSKEVLLTISSSQGSIPVFREFGKKAMKLREAAGRDLGAAIKVVSVQAGEC